MKSRADAGGPARRVYARLAATLLLIPLALVITRRPLALAQTSSTPQAPLSSATPPAAAIAPQATADKNAPEMSQRDLPATFTAKVNLVLVRVVVRDGKGVAIGTLKQDDFQLFDKGKLQVISKFAVEKGGVSVAQTIQAEPAPEMAGDPPAASKLPAHPMADQFIAYLFDDLHLPFGELTYIRDAAARHFDQLAPTTRAAVYTTSGQTMLEFTDDRAKLHDALLHLRPRSRMGNATNDCPYISYYMADLIVNKNDDRALAVATEDTIACTCGDRSGPCAGTARNMAMATAQRNLSMGELDNRTSILVLRDVVRRLSAMPGQRGVVMMSPGFQVIEGQRFDEQEVIDRAIRANVQISAIDARGLYVVIPGGDASERTATMIFAGDKARYRAQEAFEQSGVMAELASGTGGVFFQNNNDLDAGLVRTAAAPEYYYMLAFTPQNLKLDGSYHALKVTLKNGPGLTLQARRGYVAPKHELDPAQEAKREVEEAMFSREEIQDIPIEVHTQFFKPAPETAKLAVVARVYIKGLHFEKVADRNNDILTVVCGVFDQNGNFVHAVEKTIEMRLRDGTLQSLSTSGIATRSSFDVTPGSYVVRVVVRDQQGRMMAARNGVVEIP